MHPIGGPALNANVLVGLTDHPFCVPIFQLNISFEAIKYLHSLTVLLVSITYVVVKPKKTSKIVVLIQ